MQSFPTRSSASLSTATAARRARVDGWPINLPTLDGAVEQVIEAAERRESFSCFTLNLDHLVKLRDNADFQRAYRTARFVTADGEPVARIARRQWSEVERTTGADMLIPLCDGAAQRGIPVFFFGTADEVLESTVKAMQRHTGGKLIVAGTYSPPQGFDPNGAAADAAIEAIAASGAALCLVMLGAPKQEIFSARAVEKGVACGFVCVGAAADFIVGHQVRAPRALQSAGLEWAWRLAHNPSRLGMRYARCAMLLARLEVNERLQARGAPKSSSH
jgi:exopolysaccharide biosynthesis WecB/TagA/CpsF family protein